VSHYLRFVQKSALQQPTGKLPHSKTLIPVDLLVHRLADLMDVLIFSYLLLMDVLIFPTVERRLYLNDLALTEPRR
jgi:hypothetical protein